jgi:cytidylate kinase
MGDIYRQMAAEREMTALQLNLHSERDPGIDAHVDQVQRDMAASDEPLIVDSRLGWHFFKSAFKVHLIIDDRVAAQRVLGRPASSIESYESLEDARRDLRQRSDSERARFIARYHVDKSRLRNYSLVCDTTRISPAEAASHVVEVFREDPGDERDASPVLLLDPARLYPTEQIQNLRDLWRPVGNEWVQSAMQAGMDSLSPVSVGYSGEFFFIIDGHRRVSTALRAGLRLIRAELDAEAEEIVVGDMTATRYFETGVRLSTVHDWEEAHSVEIELPPHLRQQAQSQSGQPPTN